MTPQVLAKVKVHWLDADKGGRKALPPGPLYAATARFAEREDELFSVVLRFPSQDEAELGFLAPELIKEKLAPGTKLLLTEGPQIVAECEIQ